jgi:hypothetical protein
MSIGLMAFRVDLVEMQKWVSILPEELEVQ